jgi:hypothetical protein
MGWNDAAAWGEFSPFRRKIFTQAIHFGWCRVIPGRTLAKNPQMPVTNEKTQVSEWTANRKPQTFAGEDKNRKKVCGAHFVKKLMGL